jgi:hypothetical protein
MEIPALLRPIIGTFHFANRIRHPSEIHPDIVLDVLIRNRIDGCKSDKHDERDDDHVHQKEPVAQLVEHQDDTSSNT